MEEVRSRLRRLYAAVEETTEHDLSRVPAVSLETAEARFWFQDFSGGLAPEKLSNLAHSAISLIAHLPNHLRRLATRLGRSSREIDALVESCPAVSILIDLANREKHGVPRDGGRSGHAPELRNVTRVLRLSAGPEPGSAVQVQWTPAGPQVRGSGSADVVLTGDIIASDGTRLNDLHTTLGEALEAWEALVADWLPSNEGTA